MTADTSTSRVKPVNIGQPAIPVSRIPMKPKLKFKRGWIPHIITILLLSLNISLLILSYVGAAAVSSSSSTSSMADGLYMFVAHRPFNVGGKELDDAAVRAMARYGLSPFQACRFTMRKEDLKSNGTCVGSEWALKGSLDGLEAGDKLELSDALAHVFPKASHLIPIMVILNLTHLFLLIRAYKRPVHISVLHGETYPKDGSSPQDLIESRSLCQYTSSSKKATYAMAAFRGPQEWYIRLRTYDARDFWIAPLSLGLGGILLIVLLCAYRGGSEEVQVDAGLAFQVFLVAIILQPLVTFIPWLLGLKVYQKGSDKNKNYNTSCFSAYNGKSKTGYYAQFEA